MTVTKDTSRFVGIGLIQTFMGQHAMYNDAGRKRLIKAWGIYSIKSQEIKLSSGMGENFVNYEKNVPPPMYIKFLFVYILSRFLGHH